MSRSFDREAAKRITWRVADADCRAAIESELSDSQLITLREVCADLQQPLEAWTAIPFLLDFALTVATTRRVLRLSETHKQAPALRSCAKAFGVPEETLRSRFKRSRYFLVQFQPA